MRPHSRSKSGAGNRVRTDDLLITNQLLYQLSYAGVPGHVIRGNRLRKRYSRSFSRAHISGFESRGLAFSPAVDITPEMKARGV